MFRVSYGRVFFFQFQIHLVDRSDIYCHLHVRVRREVTVSRLFHGQIHVLAGCVELAGHQRDRDVVRDDRHRLGLVFGPANVPCVPGAQVRGCDPRPQDYRECHRLLCEEPARCDNPHHLRPGRFCPAGIAGVHGRPEPDMHHRLPHLREGTRGMGRIFARNLGQLGTKRISLVRPSRARELRHVRQLLRGR